MSGDKPWEHRPVGTPPEWRALSLKEQIKPGIITVVVKNLPTIRFRDGPLA